MNTEQHKSILTIALHAAVADGSKHERERDQIRRVAESLGADSGGEDFSGLYQDVLENRATLEAAADQLQDPDARLLAYETAVGVCEADDQQSEIERRFLLELRTLLKLDAVRLKDFESDASAIAGLSATSASLAAGTATGPVVAAQSSVPDAELDASILKSALINGALELLPQSWASMAIIPLQVKMVHEIGKAHGAELDRGHIKEFVAAAGVGMTAQYLERFSRKLLGGIIGGATANIFGRLGGAATGMAFSFATTYALGQLAKRYYAGGRVMNTAVLRDTFRDLLEPAKEMQDKYLPQIREQAQGLDMRRVMEMLR